MQELMCNTVLQCYSATVPQCYSATVLQCYCATVLLQHTLKHRKEGPEWVYNL
jgi:hypothetical protein